MSELESSLHVYQPPLYRGAKGGWKKSFVDAAAECEGDLTWDPAAVLGIMSFNYVCGDRTLVNEVKRQPWLSEIGPDGEVRLEEIPKHGRIWQNHSEIIKEFNDLLWQEALEVCKGRKEIYLLLSGGMDSRIVAGTLSMLCEEGSLDVKPVCVTWGLEDSRDVVYGRKVAEILGFEWVHLNLTKEDLCYNIYELPIAMGSMASPIHLHRIGWFEKVSPDALVLASSYGNHANRSEYSGRHLLELDYLRPVNRFGLIRREVLKSAYDGIMQDLGNLRDRSRGQPKYAVCENEMLGHYMRNMIGHVMSVIDRYCKVYQMFTHPKLYSYIWSIHPALRDKSICAELLGRFHPRLAHVPWARTNRAFKGRTTGARSGLRRHFLDYSVWGGGDMYDEINEYVDPEWFAETGIFDADGIRALAEEVRVGANGKGRYGYMPHEKWLWLASFRSMAEHLGSLGKHCKTVRDDTRDAEGIPKSVIDRSIKPIHGIYRCLGPLLGLLRRLRKLHRRLYLCILRRRAIREHPPDRE